MAKGNDDVEAPPRNAPSDWFTDDFEINSDLLNKFDDLAVKQSDKLSIQVVSENQTNHVLALSKSVAYSSSDPDPNITVFPRLSNGNYAFIGEDDNSIVVTPNKRYRYIVDFKYRIVNSSGAYGIYLSAGIANKNTNNLKNSKSLYIYNDSLDTSTIGNYGTFNTLGKTGEWYSASLDTNYISTDGLSSPVIALNFKVAKAFAGEVQLDDICVKRVDENDTTSMVILNPNNKGENKYNPIAYVTGANYTLPTPTKQGFEFVGWYADTNYSILCENSLPENQTNDSYTVLNARWMETTLTDDFDQKSSNNRVVFGDLSIVDGVGMYNTSAIKYKYSTSSGAVFIPKNLKGQDYVLDATKSQEYKYIAEFSYNAPDNIGDDGVNIVFDLVEAGSSVSLNANTTKVFNVNPNRGNADSSWRTASLALRFKANKSTSANIAVRITSNSGSTVLMDGIVIKEVVSDIGSYSFIGDEYTGYIETVAGEYGKQIEIENPNRNGYSFAGWQSSTGVMVSTASFGKTDEILYPKWEKLLAPSGTTELITDDFDQTVPVDRGSISDYGLDTSSWDIETFEKYDSLTFDRSKLSNYDFSDKKYSMTVESEDDGNRYLHIVNNGGNSADLRHLLWFRNEDGNLIGTINQGSARSGNFVVSYKFKYKINSNTEGSYGLYMKSALIRNDDNTNFTQKETFALTGSHKPSDDGSAYYGLADGNWHIASYSAVHSVTSGNRNKILFAGFWMDVCKRQVDVCIDDVSIKIDYYTASVGSKTAVNIKFDTDYLSDNDKTVKGPQLDLVTANYGQSIKLPVPVVVGKTFETWQYNNGDFNTESVSVSRPSDGCITLKAKYRDREDDDPLFSNFNMTVVKSGGTGKTNAYMISSTTAGNGLINLKNQTGLSFVTHLANNQKVNWIVRMRYKAESLPKSGVNLSFDLAKENTGISLSKEHGTDFKFGFGGSFNNNDDSWHTAYLPVSLTRSEINESSDVTLLINLSAEEAFSSLFLDEISLFDAGDKNVSGYIFSGKYFVDPVAGVEGTSVKMPSSPNLNYSIGKWYTDEKFLNPYAKPNENVSIKDQIIYLFADYLTLNGYYAEENFENTIEIWEDQSLKRGASYKKTYDNNKELIGKMRSFQIVDNPDYAGKCLKYDIDGINDNYSTILLTDSVSDQIYLGSRNDEDDQIYIVKFKYKVDRADTELKFSLGGCNYNAMWEKNSVSCDTVVFPLLSKTDGWQEMSIYLPISWQMGTAGENATNIYASFTINGQGLVWIDDIRYTKVYDGRVESIYFDTDEGGFFAPYTGLLGEKIPDLPTPHKNGYEFKGWYTDYSFETRFTRTVFGGDGTDESLLGTNYLYALFDSIEVTGDSEEDNDYGDLFDIDDDYDLEGNFILQDVTEEITKTKYKKKITIEKRKIGETGGFTVWIIVISVVGFVLLSAGGVFLFFALKRRKR